MHCLPAHPPHYEYFSRDNCLFRLLVDAISHGRNALEMRLHIRPVNDFTLWRNR